MIPDLSDQRGQRVGRGDTMRFVHTADSHLGFEITKTAPFDPEGRQRRAQSIFDNFLSVVQYVFEIEADLYIHSGDLFNKYYIPREILDELVRPILELSKVGVPSLIIPGNHERSEFPFDLFHGSPNVFVFDRPKSLCLTLNGFSVGFTGFPFIRQDSKTTFLKALRETEYEDLRSDLNILVTHQAFDQATVGPADFTFHGGRQDTVLRENVPLDFDYIAAGHIHRHQILPHPLEPKLHFVYPGSIQRISFAEMDEEKGFVVGELRDNRIETRFMPLPTYDMEIVEVEAAGLSAGACEDAIRGHFWCLREEMVIRFSLTGGRSASDYPDIDFVRLRAEMPPVLESQFAIKVGNRWIMR
jgi:exonuclease SbcD